MEEYGRKRGKTREDDGKNGKNMVIPSPI